MRILVVCGAGASSTFLAQRLRRVAAEAGLPWSFVPGTERSIAEAGAYDLVLVGAHLSDRLDRLREGAPTGQRIAALPDDALEDRDGARTLAWVRALPPIDEAG